MPKLADLLADRADAVIPLDRGEIAISYRPMVVTPAWQEKIAVAERENAGQEATLYGPLKEVLVSWDIEQEDGKPYPITSEGMAEVPRVLLSAVLIGVMLDARPDFTKLAATFSASSSRKVASGVSPNGSAT